MGANYWWRGDIQATRRASSVNRPPREAASSVREDRSPGCPQALYMRVSLESRVNSVPREDSKGDWSDASGRQW